MASAHGSRRYDDARSNRGSRFDSQHDRRGRNEMFGFRENENTRANGSNSPRVKQPLLQFTTDINPACFSGPIPFSLLGSPPKISPNPFHNIEPFSPNTSSNDFNLDHRANRRNSSVHDSPEDERRYRRYRDQRERDRDRERPRERDRGRERERDRSRDRTLERAERSERDRDRGRERDFRDEIPNNTIMVRSLNASITEADLRAEVVKYGLAPKDIRLIREKETGASRGFAFVEFSLLSEAVRWKELTKSTIFVDSQHRSTLHYSIPKDALGAEKVLLSRADWECAKCGMSNFRRRDYCFKCNSAREDISDLRNGEGSHEISSSPSNTLLFRNLDVLTTEERVLAMLGQLTTLPIKSLRVAKDALTNTSRGFAFVELHSTSEATQLHDLLVSMRSNFYVDGRQVTVSYAKRSLSSMNSAASANAAVVALAAAQWSNQESDGYLPHQYGNTSKIENAVSLGTVNVLSTSSKMAESPDLGTTVVQGVTYKKYPMPDISTYQYDDSSGYYYDASTGLYFDSNSQYYYNSETQQYLYWDNEQQTYLPASDETSASLKSNTIIPTSSSTLEGSDVDNQDKTKNKKEEKLDKVKIAKKIAKDMERWAKTLNQKKENAKLGIVPISTPEPLFNMPTLSDLSKHSAAADAGFAILEQKALSERNSLSTEIVISKDDKGSTGDEKRPVLVSYGDDTESESEEDNAEMKLNQKSNFVDESKLTDWQKLACLLCKRQFPSKDVLVKHQQLSDLHKKNLAKLTTGKHR